VTYPDRSHPALRPSARSAAIAFLLALSAFFGVKGYLGSTPGDLAQPRFTAASAPAPALDTVPIEQIRVGQRVLTGAADPDKTLPTAVDPRTWRHLTLEETDTWPDGTVDRICVESLMPPDWLALHDGAPVGSRVPIPLDLEEMGLPEGMTARVTANEPCPAIDRGPGRVVLTTVNHLNPRVVELCLAAGDGMKEEVRPTAFHKFYSETRGEWLSAEDLQPGEILRGLTGPLEVVSQRPVPGTHRVYNMTVEGEHVYHVSTLGVLAHNNRCRVGYSKEYAEGFERIQGVPGALRPADFGTASVAENAATLRMWNDAMRSAATSSRSNGYIRYLEALERGETPTQTMLEKAFGAVNSRFLDSARAAGMDVAEVHHWNFGKTDFPTQIVDPRNLAPTSARILHEQIHRATSATSDIWGGTIAPQHQIPIPEWSTPWTPPTGH